MAPDLGRPVLYRTTAADAGDTLEDAGTVLAAVVVHQVDGAGADLQVFRRRSAGTVLRTDVPRSVTTAEGTWWPA